jgi:nucleotide-binding universal stress UspA family protein
MVCGVDGSGGGWPAASVAASLARALNVRAVIVHATEEAGRWPLRKPLAGARARRTMRCLKTAVKERCSPIDTELRLRAGDPAQELLRVASEENAELMVVASGRSGRGGAALLGGVASGLIRRAPCPVVVVPRAMPALSGPQLVRGVVCAVELRDSDAQVLRLGADLAARLGSSLHAVHGYGPNGAPSAGQSRSPAPQMVQHRVAPEHALAAALAAAEVEARGHPLALLPGDALLRVADQQAGLVVVGPPVPGGLDSLIGGVALRAVADARLPVVVLPPHAELEPGSGHYELRGGRRDRNRPGRSAGASS